jgi:hypothetical protein
MATQDVPGSGQVLDVAYVTQPESRKEVPLPTLAGDIEAPAAMSQARTSSSTAKRERVD